MENTGMAMNILLYLAIPVAFIGILLWMMRNQAGFWYWTNPRSDWQSGLLLGVMFLVFVVSHWHELSANTPPFESDGAWRNGVVAVLALAGAWFYSVKIRKLKFREAILYFGYKPRDEREICIILRATQIAYATVMGLLLLTYVVILFTAPPSKTSFIFLILVISMFSRSAFAYTLDRLGFPVR